jgi:hypothetical protein
MMDLLEEWCLSVGHPNDLDVTGLSVALEQARLKYHAQAVRYLALGARDKTWPFAISGHPSSSAHPRIVYSIAYPLCTCVFTVLNSVKCHVRINIDMCLLLSL